MLVRTVRCHLLNRNKTLLLKIKKPVSNVRKKSLGYIIRNCEIIEKSKTITYKICKNNQEYYLSNRFQLETCFKLNNKGW